MRFRRETAMPRLIAASGGGALLVLLIGAAAATEVKYPASDPRITLQVPDNWAVATDPQGLELVSPEKDARVLLGVVGGNEKAVEAWAKDARERLVAAGTKFDKSKPTRTLIAKPPKQSTLAPKASAGYSFSGPPTVVENFGSPAPKSAAPKPPPEPFKVVQTFGSTLNGKPVDMEIAFYKIGESDFLLVEQQTGPIDARGVAIEHSLKILK